LFGNCGIVEHLTHRVAVISVRSSKWAASAKSLPRPPSINHPCGARRVIRAAGRVSSADERLDLGAQRRRDIVAGQRIGDVGGEKADLAAAVEAAAVEFQPVERLPPGERNHRVGELDFAAGTVALVRQNVENFRLQDISAGDDEVGGRT
jgi:hypothetical protein